MTKKATEIREEFLKYFERNGHQIIKSSRLIPDGDPTLLFTNAGMNQFKNTFLGVETRDYTRAASSQKCVRAGGKHNDLENVGFTARHHTFFEMLGNFSFGDYFKKEAIHFGWEFVTKAMGLDKKRLYVSVYEKDDEAADIWHKQEGVPKDRIYRFGEKDNFWRMGNSGPCGPCSEIFYDLGDSVPGDPKENVMGGSGDRFMEIWNLVFMQYNESEDGKRVSLPKPSVDTGMGLERATSVLQGQISNYDTDLFQPLIQTVEKIAGVEYIRDFKAIKGEQKKVFNERNVAMRVLADHGRATAFLIGDGVLPSNEGRGYVLRRIMRRAIRYGRNLSPEKSILPYVVEKVIEEMGPAYPELELQREHILATARDEEKRFFSTLDQGLQILQIEFSEMYKSAKKVVDGKFVFKLYDTFGFPADLTRVIARERGYEIDEATFENQIEAAREIARSSWKGKGLSASEAHLIKETQILQKSAGSTEFSGYEGVVSDQGQIVFLSDGQQVVRSLKREQTGIIALNKTCFYAESGGQVGDVGQITSASGQAEVLDCTKLNDIHIHHVKVVDGELSVDELAHLKVDSLKRASTANNHSATHLLHSALRKVLGAHVTQAGSLVSAERLRFDFTHNRPLSFLEVEAIEGLVNVEVAAGNEIETKIMSPKEAIDAGALALFGEKYGDNVRVLRMGNFSTELCGGTHTKNTAQIRFFKIVSEGGVSSGVRRIEAITGELAARYLEKNTRENSEARVACGLQENWQQYLNSESRVAVWIERAKEEKKLLEKEIQSLRATKIDIDNLVQNSEKFLIDNIEGVYVFADLEISDRELLSQTCDRLRDKIKSGIVVAIARGEESNPIIVSLTKNLVGPLNAGKILAAVAAILGGKGGGRPDFAQGAVKDLSKIKQAREKVNDFFQKI
ncbi:MAG: alanine--tRNA ligase [Bdellovibrionales bacterium RBG_16_40_8]|nr:MAG: alanine--tRNA ligase [Bdellovibrionales bacterium RBG_16_40_8]